MRSALLLAAVLAVGQAEASAHEPAPALSGDWRGSLSPTPGVSIPLVLHVSEADGQSNATVDSPAQHAFGLAVASVTRNAGEIRFVLSAPKVDYVATLSADGQTLSGKWTQGTASLPLVMTRTAAIAPPPPRRPQTPAPPYPYRSEEVAYDNLAGHAHLAGTLTMPAGAGPFPAVLLITGSGLQDRDETVFGHKPFLVWADTLTRRGIAVLRVDDRQTGGSTGEVRNATTLDFAGDVAAGVAFLRSRHDIDPLRIGLMGHSEGAIIAPLVAARDPAIGFIVMLAGSGEPGEALMLHQKRLIETASGLAPAVVEQSGLRMKRLYDAVKDAPDQASADAALRETWRSLASKDGRPGTDVPPQLQVVASPWMRWFIRHDPQPALSAVHCPVLAVGGSKDLQVPVDTNLPAIKAALRANPDATVIELAGLNHMLQTAQTGQVTEYAQIEETIAPIAQATVGDWIVAHTRR
ncbi:CocE/NonD family hydrolase [Novosphingobium sp.]|uniref:alpha/beta hydrolase family protein n=1 Tax=Novosphingobium sp. TaxID=1874826 RepID=UPI0025F38493|nr:CocE/NonD family hydrolase [Novosphingobium sp.]